MDDFSDLLTDHFDASRFANDLLKSTNPSATSDLSLDLATPVKKISYDLSELDSRANALVNKHPTVMVDQIYKEHAADDAIRKGLAPSLRYLDISYQRLQDEVMVPYQRAQKLQSVLSKVHQTADILRDALIYIHLATRIQQTMAATPRLSLETASQLTTLFAQLQLTVQENVNLRSLQVIKTLELQVGRECRKKLLDFLVAALTKECLNTFKIQNNRDTIKTLAFNLYTLSPQEFAATVHKIVLSHVAANSQILSKTINAVRTFPETLDEVVKKGYAMCTLERILADTAVSSNGTKSTLLVECAVHGKTQAQQQGQTPRDIFWSKLAANFKRDIDISFKRGGPVGKSLQRNYQGLIEAMKKYMPGSSDRRDYQKHLDAMMKSIAILAPPTSA